MSSIVQKWIERGDRKRAGGQTGPRYNEMQQCRDLEQQYGEGFCNDGYFIVYSLMDRNMLPEDLRKTTHEQADAATLYYDSGQYDRGYESIAAGLGVSKNNEKPSLEKQAAFEKALNGKGFVFNRFLRSRNMNLMRVAESCCLKAAGIGTTNAKTYNRSKGEAHKIPKHWTEQQIIDFGHALIREMGNKVSSAQTVDKEDLIEMGYFDH